MSLSTVYWRHDNTQGTGGWGYPNVLTFQTGNDPSTRVAAFGGFGTVGDSSLDEITNVGAMTDVQGSYMVPVVGTYYSDDPDTDYRSGILLFAPPGGLTGTRFQAHIWWTLEA